MKLKIVILDNKYENHDIEREVFGDKKFDIEEFRDLVSEEEIISAVRDADGILVNLNEMSEKVIESLEKCKVIGRYGIGYDNVDVGAASKKGIKVANIPDYCIEEVSDHILALFFAVLRNIAFRDAMVRKGKWNISSSVPVVSTAGKKFGIIGYGKTGRSLHRKLAGFSLDEILVYDHHMGKKLDILEKNTLMCRTSPVDFEELLRLSDFISVNVPLTEETAGFIGKKEFSLMKKNAVLVNASRGAVIDPEALIEALSGRRIGGAGIDVYDREPPDPCSALFALPNVVLTDHCAWYSADSQKRLQRMCAEAVKSVLETGTCSSLIN